MTVQSDLLTSFCNCYDLKPHATNIFQDIVNSLGAYVQSLFINPHTMGQVGAGEFSFILFIFLSFNYILYFLFKILITILLYQTIENSPEKMTYEVFLLIFFSIYFDKEALMNNSMPDS